MQDLIKVFINSLQEHQIEKALQEHTEQSKQ